MDGLKWYLSDLEKMSGTRVGAPWDVALRGVTTHDAVLRPRYVALFPDNRRN